MPTLHKLFAQQLQGNIIIVSIRRTYFGNTRGESLHYIHIVFPLEVLIFLLKRTISVRFPLSCILSQWNERVSQWLIIQQTFFYSLTGNSNIAKLTLYNLEVLMNLLLCFSIWEGGGDFFLFVLLDICKPQGSTTLNIAEFI